MHPKALFLCGLLATMTTARKTGLNNQQGGENDQTIIAAIHASEGYSRIAVLRQLVQWATGRFNNDELIARQVDVPVPENERLPPLKSTSIVVRIQSVPHPAVAVFTQNEVTTANNQTRMPFLQVFSLPGRERNEKEVHNKVWTFKNPSLYIDGWKDPSIFYELELTEGESEELVYWEQCVTTWRRSADGSNFATRGFSSECFIPLSDTVSTKDTVKKT